MKNRTYSRISTAVVVLIGLSIVLTGSVAAQSADLVVADDGTGDHTSIQNAVDNASDTDRIEVISGTYEESVSIDKNVTIVAPRRATLIPSQSDYSGISIAEHAKPNISGLNIYGFTHGIEAGGIGGTGPANTSWSASNIVINGNNEEFGSGIHALESSGEFDIRNVTINNTYFGVYVLGTTDAWQAQNLTINNPGGNGVSGYESTGAWTVEDSVIRNGGDDAIFAYDTEGSWTVESTEIINTTDGIEAGISSGDWRVSNTTVYDPREEGINSAGASGNSVTRNITINNAADGIDFEDTTGDWKIHSADLKNIGDDGIEAENTSGQWKITNTNIRNVSAHGIDASYLNQDSSAIIEDVIITDTGDDSVEFKLSSGDWNITDTVVENSSSHGIGGLSQNPDSTSTIENVSATNTTYHGVEFYNSSGDWTISNSTISDTGWSGVEGSNSSGEWIITETTIQNAEDFLIGARRATGTWNVHESSLGTAGIAINATGGIEGNASYNYWGATDGPSGDFDGSGGAVVGNASVIPYYTDATLGNLSDEIGNGDGGDGDLPRVVGDTPPQDPNNDGMYEDIDGNGQVDIFDVQAFFENRGTDAVQNNPDAFNFDGQDGVDIFDVQALFDQI